MWTNHMVAAALLACCFLCTAAAAVETYTVIAPNIVRPNTDFLVAVTAHGIESNQDVQLTIRGKSDSGQTIEIRQDTTVQRDETQIVRLRIGDLGSGKYSLSAKGVAPITFDQTQELTYVHKGYSVFIQTDKAIYRPGNIVQFRVVVVTPQLKPSVVGSFDVNMSDGGGNVIREWKRVFTTKGVFAGELELAAEPVLGDWNITVDVGGQLFTKSFLVAEYVLPKFEVDIDLPQYGTFSQGDTTVTVKATYHYGGPVKGEATISVFPKYKSSYLQPIFSEPVRRVVDIDGKVDVTFNLAKELNLNDDFAREVVFDVQVKEDLTERIQNNSNSIVLHKFPYKLELVRTADAFKPGMPYLAFLKVAYQDETPVQDDLNLLSVRWGFTSDPKSYNVSEYKIPADGILELKFATPVEVEADVLGIEATYKDLTQWFSTIPRALSKSQNYIQARLRAENPEVGKNIRIEVESTEKFNSLTYVIFGRGKLAFAETLRTTNGTKNEINFRATSEMSPRCRVIVYYVRPDSGEVVADALDFEIRGALTNFVDIYANRQNALPGTDITVSVKAKPGSFVGLMAVDKSVRSLNARNDIVRKDVLNELRSYDSAHLPSFYPWFKVIEPKEGSLYWYTGSSASRQVFAESGAIVLSNGALQNGRPAASEKAQVGYRGDNRPFGRPLPRPDSDTLNSDQGPGVEYESATRPPLAGPYAFSRLPRPVDNLPKIYLKNDLPPTLLFTNVTTDLEGMAAINLKTPDLANTTWIISGFSLDSLFGMGISTQLQQLEVFQPFFVKVDLPYTVKRGETVAIQMIVFNYLDKEISAEVTLENPGGNSFTFGTKNPNEIEPSSSSSVELFRMKRISVKSGRGTLISFIITPQEIGFIDLKITAKSGSFGQDVQIKKLLVEAEGEVMFNNTAILLDLRSNQDQEFNVTLDVPKNAVKGSEKIYISAVVDPVGPAMNNLNNLLQQPLGCGEQNMLRIAPAVILSQYLESIGQFKGQLEQNARHLMEDGYQRQLVFKLKDGSFSAFGESDGKGSLLVTSLTARYFRQAKQFVDIDTTVIDRALNWIVAAQAGSGAFAETGKVVDTRIQENDKAMTAFVSLAFLDNSQHLDATQRNALNRAVSYLAESFSDAQDPFILAIVTYVLHRAEHPLKDQAFNLLDSFAVKKDDKKYWETQLEGFDKENPWTAVPNSANIEMTAYALLTLLARNSFNEALPVARWLLSQQNENGGFASTSDTYVAILALKEFSAKAKIPEQGSDINVQYTYLQTVRKMQVKSDASTILQRRILPQETRELRVRASGGGFAVVQLGYEYNLDVTAQWPSFVLNPQVFRPSTANHMQLTICVNYIQNGTSPRSNMAVMEVNLPSGFTANSDSLPALKGVKGVKRVDSEKGNTKVIIYFESLTRAEVCPTISAFRTFRVANQKPASVLVYDYYDQSRRARSFYDVVPTTLCDICQGEDCPDDGCPDRPAVATFGSYAYGENIDAEAVTGGASATAAAAGLIAIVLILNVGGLL